MRKKLTKAQILRKMAKFPRKDLLFYLGRMKAMRAQIEYECSPEGRAARKKEQEDRWAASGYFAR